jgi:RNA polymerase sigma factor (sigma-70 family)
MEEPKQIPMNDSSSEPNEMLTRASVFDRLASPDAPVRELAWTEFRARYAPIIAGFAARCGASRQDIDDVIQDVLTGFLNVGTRFVYNPQLGRFRGYLKTCTVRAAIRRAGKNLRFQGVPLDEVPDAELAVEPIWDDLWEQQLIAQAIKIIRQESQDSLTFRAFEQYVLLDRPAEIVARELQTSVNNIHQAKARMARQLRDAVLRLRQEDGE